MDMRWSSIIHYESDKPRMSPRSMRWRCQVQAMAQVMNLRLPTIHTGLDLWESIEDHDAILHQRHDTGTCFILRSSPTVVVVRKMRRQALETVS